ncbi:MAG: D-glycero-beta-D-manno-heptose 1,7-bisphosphate 7-phosphatase [Chromatiaceae bacterium]|nr:MAG: D-glycero-beta-D-manno-heptose 1,7-bisphosphate 7-phosphatase [Chromatiaceae bacterium]
MRLVILDRDGVINQESDAFIKHPREWEPLPGSLAAIARLTNAGFSVLIATNQSGLARGLFDIDTLNAIHQTMRSQVEACGGRIDAIAFCPHGPESDCGCRKPAPGLLLELGQRCATPLAGVPVVGDSRRDLEAARAVGARPMLVLTGRGAATARTMPDSLQGIEISADLNAAVDLILADGDRT